MPATGSLVGVVSTTTSVTQSQADTVATFRAELDKYAKLFKDLGLKISE